MLRLTFATLAVLVGAARAEGSVGLVVSGDATLQSSVSAEMASWLQQHGHPVDAAALPADAVPRLIDCFVLEDVACAKKIVADSARTNAILYAHIATSGAGPSRNVTLSLYWVTKDSELQQQRSECKKCTDGALQITEDAMLTSLQGAAAATAVAGAPAPAPATSPAPAAASVSATSPSLEPANPHGVAIGVELGEPSSATVGWFNDKLALLAAVGSGTLEGPGIQVHADLQMVVTRLQPNVPVRAGLGARFYHHGYQPQSIDEIPHEHYGVRVPIAIALEKPSMQFYAEVAPGIDFKRTNACALTNGAYSICPHQQESPLFIQLVVGARWFFSH